MASGRAPRQPKTSRTSATAWTRGSIRLGRSRSFEVEASIQARVARPRSRALSIVRTLSTSRLMGSSTKGFPVAAKSESTSCSAPMRRAAGAVKSGLVSASAGSTARWYAWELRMMRATAFAS